MRKTIAVLRALGASRLFVFATVWLTVALLLTARALLSLSLGLGAAALISSLVAAETGAALPAGMGWQEARLVAAVIAIGLALATIPAMSVYRSPVAGALRSQRCAAERDARPPRVRGRQPVSGRGRRSRHRKEPKPLVRAEWIPEGAVLRHPGSGDGSCNRHRRRAIRRLIDLYQRPMRLRHAHMPMSWRAQQ